MQEGKKPNMAKTIFNSTEKSNFILNMTEEQFSKLASRGLFAAMLLAPLFTFAPEITDKASYAFTAGGLVAGGVIAMILTIIGLMKKYISKWNIIPVCGMAAMVLWGIMSLVKGCDLSISFYGFPERGEGLLAILFYFCFFTSAASLKRETAIKTVVDGIVGVGLLNSVVALIQIFTGELSHYRLALNDTINAASGLSMSPLFLALLLTLSLTAAFIGFITSESSKRRTVFIISAILFSFVMMFTYSLVGFCGLGIAVIMAVIAVFVLKAPKKRLVCLPVSIVSAAAAIGIVFSGIIGNISSYRLYDGIILWWTDSYRRASACASYDPEKVDIDDTFDVYSYLNDKTIQIIKKNPVYGTGPDQLGLVTLNYNVEIPENLTLEQYVIHPNNVGSFDRVYNEYLYTAVTRGIPSLVAMLIALCGALVLGIKSFRRRKTAEAFAVLAVTISGMLIFFVSCGSIAVTPVFWIAAGAACAGVVTDKEMKAQKKLAKKK